MKVTLVMVSSLDGKITAGEKSPALWASKEDQIFFKKMLSESNLIIMGSKTYEAARSNMTHTEGTLRIIITSKLKKYTKESIPEKLEFTSESPKTLLIRLEKMGFDKALLVGGGEIVNSFLKQHLIHEFFLTLEPKLFGVGTPLAGNAPLDMSLKLVDVKKLNKKGTLLLHYIKN